MTMVVLSAVKVQSISKGDILSLFFTINGWPLCQRPYVVLMEVSQTIYLRLNKLSSSTSFRVCTAYLKFIKYEI